MFNNPVTFQEADKAISSRVDKPTGLKYKDIVASWDEEARAGAFFSARVTSATVLSEIHRRVESVVSGQGTKAQNVELLRRYFAGDGADALAAMGFAPAKGSMGVTQLGSYARLELIINTQVRMAQETGQYQQWQEAADQFPYGIWRTGYSEEHRHEHVERDGKVYAADHPIWTQSPPGGEFNCHCYRALANAQDVADKGLTPQPHSVPFQPSSLGFNPARGMDKPDFGKRVLPVYEDKAKQQIDDYQEERETIKPVAPVVHAEPVAPAAPVENQLATPSQREVTDKTYTPKIDISDPKTREAVDASISTVSEATGDNKRQPIKTVHRIMTPEEAQSTIKESVTHVSIGPNGDNLYDIALRPGIKHPAVVDMQATAGAFIKEGVVTQNQSDSIFELIQKTEAYKAKSERSIEDRTEWSSRALAWSWAIKATSPIVKAEVADIIASGGISWPLFGVVVGDSKDKNAEQLGNFLTRLTAGLVISR